MCTNLELYVLFFLGRIPESLEYVARSERAFEEVPFPQFDLARLGLVKAAVLQFLNRNEEAAELAREARETFLLFRERPRYVKARMIEASVRYEGGAVEAALEIWRSLEGDRDVDAVGTVRLAHNIAVCVCDLGRPAEAIEPLRRCAAELSGLGLPTEATRGRWKLGRRCCSKVTLRRRRQCCANRGGR